MSSNRRRIGGKNGGIDGGKNGGMAGLTDLRVRRLKQPGVYGDGEGLYLNIADGGTKSWILRATVKGKVTPSGRPYRAEIGLGSVSLVSLADAREKGRELRKLARSGINPLDAKRKETLTFEEASRRLHAELSKTWRSEKHGKIWIAAMQNHVFPTIGSSEIERIGTAEVLTVLSPIWVEQHETARRLKQRIAAVFDWAKGHGHYSQENPVNGVKRALPSVKRKTEHMAALPWQAVPGFMSDLAARDGISARTLEFIILTAARSGEARGARWSEIDLNNEVWTVPANRMKRNLVHRVPLSPAAMAVLERVRGFDPDFVFPSIQRGKSGETKQQSVMVFTSLLKRMKRDDITTHGFRSAFRDWCSESARAEREIAEAALSHAVGNAVERAYARSDLFDRRRDLMEQWAQYVKGTLASP